MSKPVIKANDVFDELKDENNCLKNELNLSEKCVNILLNIKVYYERCLTECKCIDGYNRQNKTELNEYELQLENALNLKQTIAENRTTTGDQCVGDVKHFKDIEDIKPKVIKGFKKVRKIVLKTNIKNKIKTKTTTDETKPEFQCDFENCGKTFIYAKALNSHKLKVHNIVNSSFENNYRNNKLCYKCTECSFRTFSKQVSKDHKNVHTNQTPYQCEVIGCGKLFSLLTSLQNHKRYVHSQQQHLCVWVGCEFKTKFKHRLEVHKMIHLGDKPYVCNWPGCDFRTTYANKLKTHNYRHTGEKPYKCLWPECEWVFRERGHLATHMLKHTGVKPWKCQQCGQQFQTKQAMRFHCQRRHPQEFNAIPSAVTN